jgi:phosphopantothenoylcysteine decarboxylase/phosphopantothenate--cysteine ligase
MNQSMGNDAPAHRILLGNSGGIAAYKTPELVRQLKAAGFEIRVALLEHAAQFVSPLSLQMVSGAPVLAGHWDAKPSSSVKT